MYRLRRGQQYRRAQIGGTMIEFSVGAIVGAILWTNRTNIKDIALTLISKVGDKFFGNKTNPSA